MSYLVLARKYRPQTFIDIVGQSHVWKILQNAIKSGRIAHAYIFSGPRGTGKTTTARVFAKALNCKIKKDEPCNDCACCREIMDGSAVDVIEIDGASNRGIDEIRALRENAKYAPASLKYKIYIIDEAHQITEAAFNALLKTLEEPPEHVIFILATTEPQKVPSTILSRCQRFKFRPLSAVEIAVHLKSIIKKEKFNVQDGAAGLIASAANGSLRDSLSILDQIVSFSPDESVTEQTVRELLGLTPVEMIESLFELAAKNDSRGLIKKISRVADEGFDFIQVSRDLRDRLRNLIVVKYIGDEKEFETHYLPEETESLKKQKDLLDTDALMRGFHLMSKCVDEIRWSDAPRLVFELYVLKFASGAPMIDELIKKVEELEKGPGKESPDSGRAGSPGELFRSKEPQAVIEKNLEAAWNAALDEIRKRKPLVAGFLETCKSKKLSGNQIIISMCGGLGIKTINSNLHFVIEPAVNKAFGRQLKVLIDETNGQLAEKPVNAAEVPAVSMQQTQVEKKEQPGDFEAVDEELNPPDGNGATETLLTENIPAEAPAAAEEPPDEVIKKIVKTFSGKIVKNGTPQKNPATDRRIP